jgi:2-methylcitrate dehydratase PrpD
MTEKKPEKNRLREIIKAVSKDPNLAAAQLGTQAIIEPLAEYIWKSPLASIPEEICELAKRHILDTLASLVVSSRLKPARLAREFALSHGMGATAAHILTTSHKTTILDAIFANAITAHAAEINDFCPSAFVQPGPPVLATVFGIGESMKVSGEELLRAVIAGYEITCRLPKALGLNNLQTAGLSSHGIGPTFGSAAAAASLLKIPRDRIGHVLAYCVQQASGSFNWLRDQEHIEKAFLFAGMPARNGAAAALLVHHGFTGVSDPFSGTPNWLLSSVFIGPDSDLDKERMVRNLGIEFELPLVAYKRYPVGGPTQPGVDGLLRLIQIVDRSEIIKIVIKMPGQPNVFSEAAMPALNLRYLAAVILEDGDLTFDSAQSRERMATPSIQEKMKMVSLVHDPSQEREPRVESAIVEIMLENGRQESLFIEHVLGFPERPMNRDDVESKALSLITPLLGKDKARQLVERIWNFERLEDLQEVIGLLVPGD